MLIRKFFGKEVVETVTDENGNKKKIRHFETEQSEFYWRAINIGFSIGCRFCCKSAAYWFTWKKLKVSDYFADYGKYEEKNKTFKAPIIISNHSTGIDFVIHLMKYDLPSFLAGNSTRAVPCIGDIAEAIQCVFITS